jgi:hypothetical protein
MSRASKKNLISNVRQRKMRLRSIVAMSVVLLFVALYIVYPQIVGLIIVVSLPIILFYGLWASINMKRLEKTIIEENKNKLIQRDRTGKIRSEIDIERGYRISTPYMGYLEAIYRIRQDDQVLEFSTKAKNAEHLVKKVLKLKGEYPPIAPWNFGW